MRAKVLQFLEQVPVDNKLLTSLVSAAVTRAVLAVGLDIEDPLVGTAVALAVGAIVGYFTPNEVTALREPQPSGNAEVPSRVKPDRLADGR